MLLEPLLAQLRKGSAAAGLAAAIAAGKQAITILSADTTGDPKVTAMAHANLGSALGKSGQKKDAAASFRTALSLDPGCKPAVAGQAALDSRGSFSGAGRTNSVSEARSEEM